MYDVVIVGSGLAGVTCALEIAKTKKILILTKKELTDCNSYLAQGGIAATIKGENIDSHINDTLIAGCKLNNVETTKHIIKSGKKAIEFLIDNQVDFDQRLGEFHLTKEAAHSKRRIFHAGGDQTGKLTMHALFKQLKSRNNIDILTNARALEFIGKRLIFEVGGQVKSIESDNFVLALGGLNHLFSISTSTKTNTGDFVHLAKTAGLKLEGMQFIQFHPTAFFEENASPNFLISEALRGEGAIIKDHEGVEFMENYHPLKSLAPRDIVARAIANEMVKSKKKFMYLDMKNRGEKFYINHFPQIYNHLKTHNIDMDCDLIPICPAAHYTIGGIKVDQFGRTSQCHIYASGECASSGLHGANRLASNSLLECIVLSQEIANQINGKVEIKSYKIEDLNTSIEVQYNKDIAKFQQQFQHNLSVVRKLDEVKKLKSDYEHLYSKVSKQEFIKKNFDEISILEAGISITSAIIENPSSIGSNYIKEKSE